MIQFWTEPWFPWAIALAIGLPILLIILTEVISALARRNNPAAKPVRLLRNFVLPVAALFALLTFASKQSFDLTWVRVVGTVLGFLVILLVLSAFNVALFGNAKEGSWRERLPSIFVDLARLALILVGLAVLFSWVWNADVGGLFAALGVTSIVIGLALQNAVGSVISGLLLLFEQPFRIGDHLDTGDVRGQVVEVNWRAVHIDTGNGIQIVPNASLADSSFTNLSQSVGAYTASVTVGFSTDDSPHVVVAMLREVANGLPMLVAGEAVGVSYEGKASYSVSLPIASPVLESEAVSTFLAWVWYAARRNKLALDNDSTDPVATPERLREALDYVAPVMRLTASDVAAIQAQCSLEQYGAGETIQRTGSVPDSIRVLLEGTLQAYVPYDDGQLPLLKLSRGDYIGQTSLTREATVTTVVAPRPVLMLRIPREVIDGLVKERPALAREIGETMDLRRRLAREAVAAARKESGTIAIG
jgi:small-conductance mechanosensitive channel/CRP-like cAMP-binding protein